MEPKPLRPRTKNDAEFIREVVRMHKRAIRAEKTARKRYEEFRTSVVDAVRKGARRRQLAQALGVHEGYIYMILKRA